MREGKKEGRRGGKEGGVSEKGKRREGERQRKRREGEGRGKCYICKSVTKFHIRFDTQTEMLPLMSNYGNT